MSEHYVEQMDADGVVNALSNKYRVKTLQLLMSEPKTATETYDQYLETYDDEKHRETIYRYLETLVDAEIVEKEYHNDRGLVYSVPHHRLMLDLSGWSMKPDDTNSDNT